MILAPYKMPSWEPHTTINPEEAGKPHPKVLPYFDRDGRLVYRVSTNDLPFKSSPVRYADWVEGDGPGPNKWFSWRALIMDKKPELRQAGSLFGDDIPAAVQEVFTARFQLRHLSQLNLTWSTELLVQAETLWREKSNQRAGVNHP
jgi:hypothetical protein